MNNNEELENLEKKREDIKRDFSLAAQDPKRKPDVNLSSTNSYRYITAQCLYDHYSYEDGSPCGQEIEQ
ncbi:MAG: hypothetical protein WCS07_09095 [Sphaerochaeta sp.]|nr:hypothetical protein [Candidatus Cloacimonadota bacterium]